MTIRVLHHWACSGGTIISRSIASLPHVLLLSEVHPLAHLRLPSEDPEYCPTDLIRQVCLDHNNRDPLLCLALWTGAIDSLQRELLKQDLCLVLRSHSHIDFFTGPFPAESSLVSTSLISRHRLLELFSVRHPLDSWISMTKMGWDKHFRFVSFAEFCRRCLAMTKALANTPILRYEDFTLAPQKSLQTISRHLELSYSQDGISSLGSISLSGNSGRSSDLISPRLRQPIPESIQNELEILQGSTVDTPYTQLCHVLGYDPDPLASHPFTRNPHSAEAPFLLIPDAS